MKGVSFKICALFLFCASTIFAQTETTAFTEFRNQSSTNILPDFSFAGYHHGEIRIPTVDHTVFNVTDYGAIANDTISDKTAIQNAINAAEASNQPAVVFFPKGKFIIADSTDDKYTPIKITNSNIVLRGSGSGLDGTELFMKTFNVPKVQGSDPIVPDTTVLYKINPGIFVGYDDGINDETYISYTTAAAAKGTFNITVANASSTLLQPGNWVLLSYYNNDINVINAELAPQTRQSNMDNLSAIRIKAYYQISSVSGNVITFKEPLIYDITSDKSWTVRKANHIEEVGIENILFTGNWKKPFAHHRSWSDDSAWTILDLQRITNSWVTNCVFRDVNRIGETSSSGCISFLNNKLEGNAGHKPFSSGGSWTMIGYNTDSTYKSGVLTGQEHAYGVVGGSVGAVLWRNTFPPATGFESHAAQPRNTLLDVNTGGFYDNSMGGAIGNLPHHMQNLVFWNFNRTNGNSSHAPTSDFTFWHPENTYYFKAAPVTVIGMHNNTTTFVANTVKRVESNGMPVFPESLYEAQLNLRLGYQQGWLSELYQPSTFNKVLIYDKTDFNGKVISLSEGTYLQEDLNNLGLLNDSLSSIKVPSGFKAELFIAGDAMGDSYSYEDETYANILDQSILKQVSSIKITAIVAVGYDEANGIGTVKMSFMPGDYPSFDNGFDNKFSSFKVPSNYKLTIYSNANYGGNSQVINGNGTVVNLNSQLSNFASSLKLAPISQTLLVSLGKFEVKSSIIGNELKWTTLSENNNSHFDIIKYNNDNLPKFLAKINGKKTASEINYYSFLDKDPALGESYYALNQVDLDGKTKIYGPVSVKNAFVENSKLTASVGPLNLDINLFTSVKSGAKLYLFNIEGSKLYHTTLDIKNSNANVIIPKPKPGIYIISVIGAELSAYQKIIIN